MKKKHILFVDDDRFVLAALRRLLRSHRAEWDVDFASSGPEALQRMQDRLFDVIVSDMRMPGMDGAELLAEVRNRHPRTVRIILSGQSDDAGRLRAVGPAHQYLSKPCDPVTLRETIERACVLRNRLDNGALRRLVSQIDALPSLPLKYQELERELQTGEPSIQKVGEIVAADVAMTAKILQLVNSSFFGAAQRITSPERAVQWLGVNKIEPLVLTAGVFSQLEQTGPLAMDLNSFIVHSLAVATRARFIGETMSDRPEDSEDAFLAGMLHDLGKLILASNWPDEYQRVTDAAADRRLPMWQAEMEAFDASHSEVGAYLAGLWGLPDPIVEAIAFHHDPGKASSREFTPLTAVHIANALEHETTCSMESARCSSLDEEYLDCLGIRCRVPAWREQFQSQVEEIV